MTAVEERIVWNPETLEQKSAVRAALADILASQHFCNSKRYPAFLEYVVNAVLSGHADELKERTLGIEVFGRRPDYDTNSDTVVRYTAGEVRKRLSLYYGEAGHAAAVRIHLPVGSYVPELTLIAQAHADRNESAGEHTSAPATDRGPYAEDRGSHESQVPHPALKPDIPVLAMAATESKPPRSRIRYAWTAAAAILVALTVLALYLRHRTAGDAGDAVLTQFWGPTLAAPGSKLICSGSSVFAPDRFSGVATATKDADYPFLSIQIAQSIAHLSGFLERHNATYTVQTSAATPLTELRERPVILLGAYNNDWSIRLLEPLRFHFASDQSAPAILDRQQPSRTWARDRTQGYGSADDYAIVARFTDSMTDGPVVVLAGLGRNGTEAATEFVTSPEFIQEYANQHTLPAKTNVEFVLHSRVVDGKTGAPSIVAVYTW